MVIAFTIPGRLPALNDFLKATKSHNGKFYKGNAMKQLHERYISSYIPREFKNRCIDTPCAVDFVFYEQNMKRDPDNVSAVAHKFVLDALVKNKVIKNDSYKYIKEINDTYKIDRETPRIVVAIRYEEEVKSEKEP